MNLWGVAIIALVSGIIGGMLIQWKFWWGFVEDFRYHGFDNHLCQRPGCCR